MQAQLRVVMPAQVLSSSWRIPVPLSSRWCYAHTRFSAVQAQAKTDEAPLVRCPTCHSDEVPQVRDPDRCEGTVRAACIGALRRVSCAILAHTMPASVPLERARAESVHWHSSQYSFGAQGPNHVGQRNAFDSTPRNYEDSVSYCQLLGGSSHWLKLMEVSGNQADAACNNILFQTLVPVCGERRMANGVRTPHAERLTSNAALA